MAPDMPLPVTSQAWLSGDTADATEMPASTISKPKPPGPVCDPTKTIKYHRLRVNVEQATGAVLHSCLPILELPELATLDSVRGALLKSPLAGESYDIFFPRWTTTLYITRAEDESLENLINVETDEVLRELLKEELDSPGTYAIRLEQCKNEKYSRFRREPTQAPSNASCTSSVSSGSNSCCRDIPHKPLSSSKRHSGWGKAETRRPSSQQNHHHPHHRPTASQQASRKPQTHLPNSPCDRRGRCFDGPTIEHISCTVAGRDASAPTGEHFLPENAFHHVPHYYGEREGRDVQFYPPHPNVFVSEQQGLGGMYPHMGPFILYCVPPPHIVNGFGYPSYSYY